MLRTWVEINARALAHNIAQLKRCTRALLAVVIKGNAYGHGLLCVAQLLETNPDVHMLCVAGTQEAIALKKAGIKKNILAMSYIDCELRDVVEHDIAITVYDEQQVLNVQQEVQKYNKKVRVHVKIDTGMSRLGGTPTQVHNFIALIRAQPSLSIEGIFTHLSDTNALDDSFSCAQLDTFDCVVECARGSGQEFTAIHALASGSLYVDRLDTHVRVGTNVFGYWKSDVQKERFLSRYPDMQLHPVLQWKTHIMQVKTIAAGDYVGYNRTFKAANAMRIALLPVGYADGYPRCLSNKAQVSIGGVIAPVIGIVSMNLMAIDITHLPLCAVHDEVVLIGDHQGVRVEELAVQAQTIANEFVTRISPTIVRLVV